MTLSSEYSLPSMATPVHADETLVQARVRLAEWVEHELLTTGAVLFRGFNRVEIAEFQNFAASFGHPLLNYEFASTPRNAVSKGIYTSTEYPAHSRISLHGEQSYTREWPLKIWFHCALAATRGGETPIADARQVLRRMPPALRARFAQGIIYVRNYSDEIDLPWQQVFNCSERVVVEEFCARNDIQCEWLPNNGLRTRQLCQAIAVHPRTGEAVWFNQAHLFHSSALDAELRDTLIDIYGEENLPRNTYYGDGSVIPDDDLATVRAVLDSCKVIFPWENGDVLMLDNMLTMHAREPFEGPRKVVVAMAESYRPQYRADTQIKTNNDNNVEINVAALS